MITNFQSEQNSKLEIRFVSPYILDRTTNRVVNFFGINSVNEFIFVSKTNNVNIFAKNVSIFHRIRRFQ